MTVTLTGQRHSVGRKIVIGTPMTRGEYNSYRGWILPDDENGADAGYLVEYVNGGDSNHPGHAGYISWSPKAIYEGSYFEVGDISAYSPADQEVFAEHAELRIRHTVLDQQVNHSAVYNALPEDEQSLLNEQLYHQRSYLNILEQRLLRIIATNAATVNGYVFNTLTPTEVYPQDTDGDGGDGGDDVGPGIGPDFHDDDDGQ